MITSDNHDEVSIAWRDIVYDVPVAVKPPPKKDGNAYDPEVSKTKRILHGVSGHVKAGEVVAVMGPSGSGKTSLIHVLGGRRETGVTGTFIINGKTHQNTRSLLQDLGYVTQEDVLMTTLTTRETLAYATRLRLAPRELDKSSSRAAAITAIVDRAIDERAATTDAADVPGVLQVL